MAEVLWGDSRVGDAMREAMRLVEIAQQERSQVNLKYQISLESDRIELILYIIRLFWFYIGFIEI